MLSKNNPVRLFPFIAGMLDGTIHPINPKPITFRSVRSQSLSKHVNFPPPAFASVNGFLAVTGAFKKPELRDTFFVDRGEVPKPTTAEALAIEAAIFGTGLNWSKACSTQKIVAIFSGFTDYLAICGDQKTGIES